MLGKVLVVSCDELHGYALNDILGDSGEVLPVSDLNTAVETVCNPENKIVAVLICGKAMAQYGKALIDKMRTNVTTAAIPVIAVTTDTSDSVQLTALESGANDCIVLPNEGDTARYRIKNAIKLRESTMRETNEARKRMSEASQQLNAIMDNVNSGVCAVTVSDDGEIQVVFANSKYFSMFGYTREQFEQELGDIYNLVHPEDREEIKRTVELVISERSLATYKYRCVKRNGEIIHVRCNASITKIEGISDTILLSVVSDITNLTLAQQRVTETKQRLQAIMDNVDCGITAIVIDENLDVDFVFVNDKYCELLGYTKSQYMQEITEPFSLIYPEDSEKVLSKVRGVCETGINDTFVFRAVKRDGSVIWLRDSITLTCFADMDSPVQLSIFTDITAEMLAQQDLRETDEQLRFLNNTAHDVLAQADSNAGVEHVLKSMLDYFGGDRAYVFEFDNEKGITSNTYEVCAPGVKSEIENLKSIPFDSLHFWIDSFKNNNYISIESVDALDDSRAQEQQTLQAQGINALVAVPLKMDGRLVGFVGVDDPSLNENHVERLIALGDFISILLTRRDLTAKIESDREMNLRLMNDTPGGFARVRLLPNSKVKMVYANDGFCELTGMTREQAFELYSENALSGVHPDDVQELEEILEGMGANGQFAAKYRLQKGENDYIWVMAFGRVVVDEEGERYLNMYYSDMSAQKKLEDMRNELLENLPGGAGIYKYYTTGRLEEIYRNEGYFRSIAANREQRRNYNGFSVLKSVHPDDIERVTQSLRTVTQTDDTIGVEVRLLTGDNEYKWFNISANVAIKTDEYFVLYASYADINQLKKTQLHLESSRKAMEIASTNSGINFWLYHIDSKRMTQEFQDFSPLGLPKVIENVPDSMLDGISVAPESESEMRRMYDEMYGGASTSQATVRTLNFHSKKYEWQHVVYTRLYDEAYGERMAIGFSANVDLQHDTKQRYEHELQLRREMIRDSVLYYQINLTTKSVEEYYSKYDDCANVTENASTKERILNAILHRVAPEDKQRVIDSIFSDALLREYKQGKTSVSVIYRRYVGEQGLRWVESTATIIERPITNDVVAFIYCRDIDREKKDRLAVESIMEEEIESVVVINVESGKAHVVQLESGSEAQNECDDFPFDEKCRTVYLNKLHADDVEMCESFFKVSELNKMLESDAVAKLTFRFCTENGAVIRKKTRAFYLDETHREIILIRRDITDLYEEEQRQKRALEAAVESANDANRAKSDFLSRMSHDIRTPLNAVIGMVNLAKDESNPPLTVEYLDNIDTSSHFLLGLINDILDLSRIENGKIELREEPLSEAEFARSLATVIEPMMDEKSINFTYKNECSIDNISVDKLRFTQIFFNLLSNAAKYTDNGGVVELKVVDLPEENGKNGLRFTVSDNGIGMTQDFLKIIFEPFSQEKRGNESIMHGTGLGLAIVKNLIDTMGGKIRVKSEPGVGTCFTVDMYVHTVEKHDVRRSADTDYSERMNGLRVLLVEDNVMNIIVAKRLLERRHSIVDVAKNGLEALEMFEKSAPEYYGVILMDVRMPVMNGIEATQNIRALPRADAKSVPIIAMTADAFNEDRNKTQEAGMNAHLAKPIEPVLLYETIGMLVTH